MIRCLLSLLVFGVCLIPQRHAGAGELPNIVYILADDMGYGDIRALNPECKIETPHLDALASEGMVFTDAHSSSSVCTPTRYGILTGRYNWRSRLKSGVLFGYDRRLIEPDRLIVPAFLQRYGYHTACVGKWHLGLDWPLKEGGFADGGKDATSVDFTAPIKNGPNSVGFDYFFGISASLDMPPYVFIENDRCTALPTVQAEKGYFGRPGAAVPGLTPEQILPDLTDQAVDYIRRRTEGAAADAPFFLYFPLPAPHTPIAPTKEWQGKSGLNAYGDFVMQVDDTVGQVMAALRERGVAENTLLIFTADNGCSPAADIEEMHAKSHRPNHHFRGHKADIYDGGHRVPFIARWPKWVEAGSSSNQLVCLTDLLATCAEIVEDELPDDTGEDSVSILPALHGEYDSPRRTAIVHHSIRGAFSIRRGKWKLELCPGSGGWSRPRPGRDDLSSLPDVQLYDMEADVSETTNLQAEYPEIVAELTELLRDYVDRGRSTPGPVQPNNGPVDIHRAGIAAKRR